VLNVKMDHIEEWTEARRAVALEYDRLLASGGYGRPCPPADSRHVYHVYAVQVPKRDEVQNAMIEAEIGTGIHYPVPVHLQEAYLGLGYRRGDFPVSETLAEGFLSLPIYAELRRDEAEQVVTALDRAVMSVAGMLPGWKNDG
jgi:dTDP-4-amino-4,6-dideoxygalactose transaminase